MSEPAPTLTPEQRVEAHRADAVARRAIDFCRTHHLKGCDLADCVLARAWARIRQLYGYP